MTKHKPEILAPAGDKACFLAAIAAGADAVYCGLKHFSARMEADNFSIADLSALAALGRQKGVKTYIAMNTLLKPGDIQAAGKLLDRVARHVKPEAIIFQDLGMVSLARQIGYEGELHLSTLANATHPVALQTAAKLGVSRVVIPRELNLDEAKEMAEACPEGMTLELFIHGALCYCVSGRCYWSSYHGGKSGLRGRCVQPCRRLYGGSGRKEEPKRLFSCLDLSLDVLTKPMLSVPQVRSWKIEGRKKGPHYVYYAVTGYRMLRDEANNAQSRKNALELLELALGRPSSHSTFLPQRPFVPLEPANETGSGMLIGISKQTKGASAYFNTRQELLPGDFLRIGYQDQPGHRTMKIRRYVPKRGRVDIPKGKSRVFSGTKVFLIDRREQGLVKALSELEKELDVIDRAQTESSSFTPEMPASFTPSERYMEQVLLRNPPKGKFKPGTSIWLAPNALERTPRPAIGRAWWHLPPVIWPGEESELRNLISHAVENGAKDFVLNAPWQLSLFEGREGLRFHAGPFCNISNALALKELHDLGFSSAYVCPELAKDDFLALPEQSPIPLGVVFKGMWPLGISRIIAEETPLMSPLYSRKKEICWVRKYGQNYWIFPGWPLDLTKERKFLERAGYSMFLDIRESWPKAVPEPHRSSNFNWDLTLY